MPEGVPDHGVADPRELRLRAHRAHRLAWTAGDRLTYERLKAYAEELEAKVSAFSIEKTRASINHPSAAG